jgi:hypothetical protein
MKTHKFGASQYEAHLNIDKLEDSQTHPALLKLLTDLGLKVVDLVNIPLKGLESEEFGTITTMHSDNLQTLIDNTRKAVLALQKEGYRVLRYKVESCVLDSKFEDSMKLL